MAKKKAEDPVILGLAEQMPGILESLKGQGDGAYPPTLRHLAGLCDPTASDEQISKAAGKPDFKAKASAKLANRKPDLDAPVHLKGDEPKKTPPPKKSAPRKPKVDGTAELAGRMLVVLESQRSLGHESYPPTLRRLAALCEVKISEAPKVAGHEAMAGRTVAAKMNRGKPDLDAPILLKEDAEGPASDLLPALLHYALKPTPPKGKAKESHAFDPVELEKRLIEPLQKPFALALATGIERRDLPPDVAWVVIKGKPLLFLVENLRPGPPKARVEAEAEVRPPAEAPSRDFADVFRAAFDRLDRRNGSTNFVKLSDLRRELADFDRDAFDAGLDRLRVDWQFSLNSHEGLLVTLTPEEREAGIREAGSLLVYASRR
jgi:hypothetical protein